MFINQAVKLPNAPEEVGHRGHRSGIWSSVLGTNEPEGLQLLCLGWARGLDSHSQPFCAQAAWMGTSTGRPDGIAPCHAAHGFNYSHILVYLLTIFHFSLVSIVPVHG